MKIDCPHCGVHGSIDDSFAGKKLRCPQCSKVFLVSDDALPAAAASEIVPHDTLTPSEPQLPSESFSQSPGEDTLNIETVSLQVCSVCNQSFSSEFLVEIDSRLFCTLCQPEESEEEMSADDLLEIMEEEEELEKDETAESGEDLLTNFAEENDEEESFDEDAIEMVTCSKCKEPFHPEFMETVDSKPYCALCLPDEDEKTAAEAEESLLDDAETEESAESVDSEETEESGIDTDAAQALLGEEDDFDSEEYPREACSVCGEKFHLDFLQEVDSKFYCGICQPEVIEEIVDEEDEEGEEKAEEEKLNTDDSDGSDTGDDDTTELESTPEGSDFTVGDLIKGAWQKTKGAKGALWGAQIVMTVILAVLSFAGIFGLQTTGGSLDPSVSMGIYSGIQLLTTWLSILFSAGMMLIGVRRAREQRVSWKMIFAGFSKALSITVAIILQTILICIGLVLLVLPGIYLAVGYGLTLPLILDKGLGPWEALETSRKAIHKKWWTVLGAYLVMMLLYLVSAIPLGLGLIWTIPMFFVLIGVLYVHLFGGEFGLTEESELDDEEGDEYEEELSEEQAS